MYSFRIPIYKIVLFFSVILLSSIVHGQNIPTGTNFYSITPEYLNPAFTGHRQVLNASMSYNNNLIGVEGAPEMQVFNLSLPWRQYSPYSIGATLVRITAGPLTYNKFLADQSYAVKIGKYFSESKLIFGIRFGGNAFNLSGNQGEAVATNDVALPDVVSLDPQIGLGVAYKTKLLGRYSFKFGIGMPSVLEEEGESTTSRVSIMFLSNIPFVRRMVLSPSFLVYYAQGVPSQYNINLAFSIVNYALLLGYDESSISAGAGLLLSPQLYVGASYKIRTKVTDLSSSGFEMSLRYDMFGKRNLGMRYRFSNEGMFRTY